MESLLTCYLELVTFPERVSERRNGECPYSKLPKRDQALSVL